MTTNFLTLLTKLILSKKKNKTKGKTHLSIDNCKKNNNK